MSRVAWARPPGGEAVRLTELREIAGISDPGAVLRRRLSQWLGPLSEDSIHLRRSGRDALRAVFESWKETSERREILVPAYTCYSVPAAVVAAGFRVRLVEVDLDGRIDLESLAATPLEGVAGLVVCNLFGWAESIADIAALAAPAGVRVLDDAAQSLGARDLKGQRVGIRGFDAVLSFGRGKPLQGLGGGAVLRAQITPDQGDSRTDPTNAGNADARFTLAAVAKAIVRSVVWDASLTRPIFSLLAGIPMLGIGRTEFDPGFATGAIDPGNAAIAAAQLPAFEERAASRRRRALDLAEKTRRQTGFVSLVDVRADEGVYSRLALRAPDAAAKTRALVRLAEIGAGASPLYPECLADVPALQPHLAASGREGFAQSRSLAARILTLPTNRDRSDEEDEAIIRCLIEASGA